MVRQSPELIESEEDNAMNVDNNEKIADDEGSEAGEEDGSEYEIEEIMDAKRGAFPEGRMGYLVKWKGYGEEENSWVDERDTENAKELVAEFWRKNPKKKPRKSVEPASAKRARKSSVPDESDDASTTKKRGRKPAIKIDSGEDEEEPARSRKPRKAEKPPARGQKISEEPPRLYDMSKYMDRESWEDIVDTVDTVERTDDGLFIYFTLKSGEYIRDNADVCRKRFPQKLLSFYESNLKWRAAEANTDD